MQVSIEMQQAVEAFRRLPSDRWSIEPQPNKPIYTLVKIITWPRAVHYEFRYSQQEGLFVELHAEERQYRYLDEVMVRCRDTVLAVRGRKIEFFHSRPAPNRKVLPSLSIHLGHEIDGTESAQIMATFIAATREKIGRSISY